MVVATEPITLRQRLCIFHNSTCATPTAFQLEDADITYDLLRSHECQWQCIAAGGITPTALAARGASSAAHYKGLGMDAFDLVELICARDMVRLFGADEVRKTFVCKAEDAVALAGTEAARLLKVRLDYSLELSAGEPISAGTILARQYCPGDGLAHTTVARLLDTGIRRTGLHNAGISLSMLSGMTPPPTVQQLNGLGYSARAV